MRIAIISPYSWTYAGGVNRHVESLACELIERRHEVRVLAPFDPPDRLARALHRGSAPELRTPREYLIPLGRTIGFPANGAVSNLSFFPDAAAWTGRRWFGGDYEVIPNGVDVSAAPPSSASGGEDLRVLFVGRPEERKGLPVLLSAFEALAEHVPSILTLVGIAPSDVR